MFGLFKKNNMDKSFKRALRAGDFDEVRRLTNEKPQLLEETDEEGNTPLHIAIKNNREEVIELLLAQGVDIHKHNNTGSTPLHLAVKESDLQTVRMLLSQGADMHIPDDQGFFPIHIAVENRNVDMIKLLMEYGESLSSDSDGIQPIHVAIQSKNEGYSEFIKFLLNNGADINAKNHSGETPLHMAVKTGSMERIDFLLDNGADIRAKDNRKNTPLHHLMNSDNEDKLWILDLFIQYKADLNAVNSDLETPLHIVAKKGTTNLASMLLIRGAYPDWGNPGEPNSLSPIDIASANNNWDIVKVIMQYSK